MAMPGGASWPQIRRGLRYQFGSFETRDFSGGLNLSDAPSELAPNESPYMSNVTLDERGGVVKRLGLTALSTLTNPLRMYWSPMAGRGYVQDGTAIKTTTDFVTFTTCTTTMADTSRGGFCEFGGKVFFIHPTSGLYWHDGTTSTTLTSVGTGPKGFSLAAWQGALFAVGDPANPTRVWRSGANDGTDWNEAGTGGATHNDIRDTNDAPLTAIGTGTGIDLTAKPTLLVFKKRSVHRINDSTKLGYQTIAVQAGASGPMATTGVAGYVYSLNDVGIWRSDGVNPPVLVSQKLQPLFVSEQQNFAALSGVVATTVGQRAIFSLPFGASQATNNLTLEYNPLVGWFTSHTFGLSCAYPFLKNTSKLYGCGAATNKVYDVFTGWTDDGSAITANFQTRWFTPTGSNQLRVQRVRLFGRGIFGLYFKQDYQISDGLLNNVSITGNGFSWNGANWNDPSVLWGPLAYEGYQDFHALGIGKAVSFLFRDSSTTSAFGPNLLSTGAAPQVGSFACYGLQVHFAPLGIS